MSFAPSELILNPDLSIYHLNLHPEDIADTIILVGDPARVPLVSKHFDRIEVKKQKREFLTHTGMIGHKRVSVLSTGIGSGSIDIVMNELDALVNIDFTTREIKQNFTQLNIIRFGTCGGLQPELELHDLIFSEYAFSFDGLLKFYNYHQEEALCQAIKTHFAALPALSGLYVAKADWNHQHVDLVHGITLTCPGFYGPQGRALRAPVIDYDFFKEVCAFHFNGLNVMNFEMETAAILGLGQLLGHRCASLSVVAANRATRQFSDDMASAINKIIELGLTLLQ